MLLAFTRKTNSRNQKANLKPNSWQQNAAATEPPGWLLRLHWKRVKVIDVSYTNLGTTFFFECAKKKIQTGVLLVGLWFPTPAQKLS